MPRTAEEAEAIIQDELRLIMQKVGTDYGKYDAYRVYIEPCSYRMRFVKENGQFIDPANKKTIEVPAIASFSYGGGFFFDELSVLYCSEDYLRSLVRHEVAHALAYDKYGRVKGAGHGKEWKECVIAVGGKPDAEADTRSVNYPPEVWLEALNSNSVEAIEDLGYTEKQAKHILKYKDGKKGWIELIKRSTQQKDSVFIDEDGNFTGLHMGDL